MFFLQLRERFVFRFKFDLLDICNCRDVELVGNRLRPSFIWLKRSFVPPERSCLRSVRAPGACQFANQTSRARMNFHNYYCASYFTYVSGWFPMRLARCFQLTKKIFFQRLASVLVVCPAPMCRCHPRVLYASTVFLGIICRFFVVRCTVFIYVFLSFLNPDCIYFHHEPAANEQALKYMQRIRECPYASPSPAGLCAFFPVYVCRACLPLWSCLCFNNINNKILGIDDWKMLPGRIFFPQDSKLVIGWRLFQSHAGMAFGSCLCHRVCSSLKSCWINGGCCLRPCFHPVGYSACIHLPGYSSCTHSAGLLLLIFIIVERSSGCTIENHL